MRTAEMTRRLRNGNPDLYEQCDRILAELDAETNIAEAVARACAEWGEDRVTAFVDDANVPCDCAGIGIEGHCFDGRVRCLQALILAARGDVCGTLALRRTYGLPAFC